MHLLFNHLWPFLGRCEAPRPVERERADVSRARELRSITGGIDWYDAYEPLRDVSALAIALMSLGAFGGMKSKGEPNNVNIYLKRSGCLDPNGL